MRKTDWRYPVKGSVKSQATFHHDTLESAKIWRNFRGKDSIWR